ncbi:IS110 family transposase [Rhodococcus sp. T2V]|uniref:IS110 family transposase n=1 Tax=Rhodococcus sp. T2V TaxID=3034164 RepID=UPI0023E305B0|nr:IS110 family transposase [Rhodococcus sp. T2V]MDF3313020.1 IS110 family transposase [Rhodococcus sp. T2V]
MDSNYAVYCGIDVGKGEHHAVGLTAAGKKIYDKALPNDETKLRAVFDRLANHGSVLVVVDQPNTIGALPVTVARACNHDVGYLPGLAMRRIADLYPGQAKTDARDAFIIADTARTMPHTLRRVFCRRRGPRRAPWSSSDSTTTLPARPPGSLGRIRGLLTSIHPALERVLGPRIAHPAVLEVLSRCGGPAGIRQAGKRKLTAIAVKHAPRMGARLATDILAALDEQTVVVPGTAAAETVLPKLADSLKGTLLQRKTVAEDVERALDEHPLSRVLTSMPGIGVRTAARILIEVGDGSAFPSAAHLAAYAGIAPVTRKSGSSIRGEHPARSGNKKLKRALFLSAFSALHDPTSRAYYDKKRAEKKKHNAALICLARRRCDVLYAMLKNKELYRAPLPSAA